MKNEKPVEVKLNQQEQDMLSKLPEAMRPQVEATLLASKRTALEIVAKNRKDFSIVVNDNGNLVIRGIGNRFPLGLRPDSALVLCDHVEEIRAAAKAQIAKSTTK